MTALPEPAGAPEAAPSPGPHLNLAVRGLRPSATLAVNERCRRLIREGRRVFRLGLGQSPFPVPEGLVASLREHAHEKDYLPVQGLPALREAVAARLTALEGAACTGDDVLVGPGTKELMFLLALCTYAELVVPTPSWVSYAPQAHLAGRPVRRVPTEPGDRWRLTADALGRACAADPHKPRVVVLNYPSNPTGYTYAPDELEALAEVARRHRLIVLSDEIYGGLHHQGRHVSLARFYPEGTIVSDGLSKWCGAGGWRLGAFAFPRGLRWLLEAMCAVASETYTSVSAPIQHAAVRGFAPDDPELEAYLTASRRIVAALGAWAARALTDAGVPVAAPEGGFYLFPDLTPRAPALRARGIATSRDLAERLLEDTGVALLPGEDFGRPPEELTCRLAYVDFDGARALARVQAGAAVDDAFLEASCGDVLEAIRRLIAWVKA